MSTINNINSDNEKIDKFIIKCLDRIGVSNYKKYGNAGIIKEEWFFKPLISRGVPIGYNIHGINIFDESWSICDNIFHVSLWKEDDTIG